MKIEEIKQKYYFETLTKEHDLTDFDCGDEELNDFLKKDALNQQNAKLNITKLIMCENKIIGFTSILTDTIMIKKIRDETVKSKIIKTLKLDSNKKTISAVKIGRLAIDKKYIRKGLGTIILRNIIKSLKTMSEDNIGFRFIIVEGYAEVLYFYIVKNGFENLKKDDKLINNIDFIIPRDPKKKFFLYFDLNWYEKIE
jgi:predicted GNAT family N-acyltransferase